MINIYFINYYYLSHHVYHGNIQTVIQNIPFLFFYILYIYL
jgi:hypothetical protein